MKVKYTAVLITLITVGFAGSLQAQMTFAFSDDGSGKTLITASGSANLSGGTPAIEDFSDLIGWDDYGNVGPDESTVLISDSSFHTYKNPSIGGGFTQFTVSGVGVTVAGVALELLEMDGTNSPSIYPYFQKIPETK